MPPIFRKFTPIDVELIDGSLFHCKDITFDKDQVELTLLAPDGSAGQKLAVPMTLLATMLREANDARNRLNFQALVRSGSKRDMIVFNEGTRLNASQGTFGEAGKNGRIAFTDAATGGDRSIKITSIHGMIFRQIPGGARPATLGKVVDRSKNILFAQSITATKGGAIAVETVAGLKVNFAGVDALAQFDFSSAVLKYISDLDPINITAKLYDSPLNRKFRRWRRDTNPAGDDPIRLERVKFVKGLSVPSGYDLTYDIGGDYKELRGQLGIDDSMDYATTVQVKIEADGKTILDQPVKRGEPVKALNLDVRNVKELRVIVSSPEENLGLSQAVSFGDFKVTK